MTTDTSITPKLTTPIITADRQNSATTEEIMARLQDLYGWLALVELDNILNPEDTVAYNTDDEQDERDRLIAVIAARKAPKSLDQIEADRNAALDEIKAITKALDGIQKGDRITALSIANRLNQAIEKLGEAEANAADRGDYWTVQKIAGAANYAVEAARKLGLAALLDSNPDVKGTLLAVQSNLLAFAGDMADRITEC